MTTFPEFREVKSKEQWFRARTKKNPDSIAAGSYVGIFSTKNTIYVGKLQALILSQNHLACHSNSDSPRIILLDVRVIITLWDTLSWFFSGSEELHPRIVMGLSELP